MVCCVLHWLGGALLTDGDSPQFRLIRRRSDDFLILLTYCPLRFGRGKRLQCIGHCEDYHMSSGTLIPQPRLKLLVVRQASLCSLDLITATAVYNANPITMQ
jgi:hypothetical protein